MILLSEYYNDEEEVVDAMEHYYENRDLKTYVLGDEKSKGLFSSTTFGFLTMFMMLVSVLSSKLIADDRFNLTIKRMFISPIRRSDYIIAGFLSNYFFQVIQVIVICIICFVAQYRFAIPLGTTVLLLLSFGIFSSFFGMLIGFMAESANQMLVISQMIILPGTLLCGTFFEFTIMPEWLQTVSFLFPQTWVTQSVTAYVNFDFPKHFTFFLGYVIIICFIVGMVLRNIIGKRKITGFY